MSHQDYADRAYAELQIIQEATEEVITDLDQYPARWHPTGFMVYQLGIKPDLGMLRLHIWPAADRKTGSSGDTIHDHAWHVASLVLRGVYHDEIYEVEPADEQPDNNEEVYRVLDTNYGAVQQNPLLGNGRQVRITATTDRRIAESEFHSIEPGIFHKPIIPIEQAVATLVFLSFRTQEEGPFVLTSAQHDFPDEKRPEVTAEERRQTQLLWNFVA